MRPMMLDQCARRQLHITVEDRADWKNDRCVHIVQCMACAADEHCTGRGVRSEAHLSFATIMASQIASSPEAHSAWPPCRPLVVSAVRESSDRAAREQRSGSADGGRSARAVLKRSSDADDRLALSRVCDRANLSVA
jgi:hypothetical protein